MKVSEDETRRFDHSPEVLAWRSRWTGPRLEAVWGCLNDTNDNWWLSRLRRVGKLDWYVEPEFNVVGDEWDVRLDLRGFNLMNVHLFDACYVNADLRGARLTNGLFKMCDFTGADLRGAELDGAQFFDCRMDGVRLEDAILLSTRFRDCDLAHIQWKPLRTITGASVVGCHLAGSRGFERFIRDEQWLEEYRRSASTTWRGRATAWLWGVTSDYGRSLLRWSLASLGAVLFFWLLLGACSLSIRGADARPFDDMATRLYFSVVTFTTLGFGDVVPVDSWGRLVAASEVVVGYGMLGALVSILADKFARRS